jgi:hypothetical protein
VLYPLPPNQPSPRKLMLAIQSALTLQQLQQLLTQHGPWYTQRHLTATLNSLVRQLQPAGGGNQAFPPAVQAQVTALLQAVGTLLLQQANELDAQVGCQLSRCCMSGVCTLVDMSHLHMVQLLCRQYAIKASLHCMWLCWLSLPMHAAQLVAGSDGPVSQPPHTPCSGRSPSPPGTPHGRTLQGAADSNITCPCCCVGLVQCTAVLCQAGSPGCCPGDVSAGGGCCQVARVQRPEHQHAAACTGATELEVRWTACLTPAAHKLPAACLQPPLIMAGEPHRECVVPPY